MAKLDLDLLRLRRQRHPDCIIRCLIRKSMLHNVRGRFIHPGEQLIEWNGDYPGVILVKDERF